MPRRKTLLVKTSVAHLALLIAMVILAFGPNPELDYWQAWAFLPLFVGASLFLNLYLLRASPELLARRLSIGPVAEREAAQRRVMLIILLGAIMLIAVPAVDHRMNGSHMPIFIPVIGNLLAIAGWIVFFLVFRENAFASAIVEIAPDQKVITTGPYSCVRHPMYSGAGLMLVGAPLALGSWWGLLVSVAMIIALAIRILDEERFLRGGLPGYAEYQTTTVYRLFPGIW